MYQLQKEEEFVFTDIFERPVPSLLRGYSAPIRLESDLTDDDLFFLLANDSDEFNRFVFFKVAFCSCLDKHLVFLFDSIMEIHILPYLKWLRWEAGQTLARKLMLTLVDDFQHNKPLVLNSSFVDGFKRILCDSSLDKVC